MGWLSRTTGCVFLFTISAQAHAGARIAYPTPTQMYALLGGDVHVTFGNAQPPITEAVPSTDTRDQMPILLPARHDFAAVRIGFVPSARDYGMSVLDAAAPLPVIESRINPFWNIRQDVFPEQQRVRLHSLTDGMLTLSIGGANGAEASLSINGGFAGALWTIAASERDRAG
ncbi:MAG: hypothetical protein ABI240_10000 [Sphingomonas sp.]